MGTQSISTSEPISQLHKLPYFIVHVLLSVHAKMVIELLLLSRNLRDLLKAKIIRIGFLERKYHMNKILSEPGDVRNAFSRSSDSNHRLGRVQRHRPCFSEFISEVIE